MPAANQAGLGCELRMRSTGLSQLAGGAGTSTSSIRKSPFGASGTPTPFVLCSVKGATASQISVAKTLALALKPIALPPPSSKPRPSTSIRPSTFTSALRAEITQIWPGGWTPRTMFRVTTSAVAACPTPAATGRTPIPPRNFTRVSSATADRANSVTTNGKRTKAFFMVLPPLTWLDPPGRTGHAIARPGALLRSWWPSDGRAGCARTGGSSFQQECERRAGVATAVFREDIIILDFPSYEAAEAWYQAASEHRFPRGDYRCISPRAAPARSCGNLAEHCSCEDAPRFRRAGRLRSLPSGQRQRACHPPRHPHQLPPCHPHHQ